MIQIQPPIGLSQKVRWPRSGHMSLSSKTKDPHVPYLPSHILDTVRRPPLAHVKDPSPNKYSSINRLPWLKRPFPGQIALTPLDTRNLQDPPPLDSIPQDNSFCPHGDVHDLKMEKPNADNIRFTDSHCMHSVQNARTTTHNLNAESITIRSAHLFCFHRSIWRDGIF